MRIWGKSEFKNSKNTIFYYAMPFSCINLLVLNLLGFNGDHYANKVDVIKPKFG